MFRSMILVLCVVCAPVLADATLQPANDGDTVRSGRAWLAKPPGEGEGALKQVDIVSPVIVGDGKEDQGWGYIMGFVATDEFVKLASEANARVTLTVKTGTTAGGGSPGPIKLHLLGSKKPKAKWSVFGAYNDCKTPVAHETTVEKAAADASVSFDVGKMLQDAGGIEAGKVVYFVLMSDPMAVADGKGQHTEIVSEGESAPALVVKQAAK